MKVVNEEFNNRTTKGEKERENDMKEMIIKGIQAKETLSFDNIDLKKKLIQKSFWMAESDQDRVEDLKKFNSGGPMERPKKILICPGDNKHRIKLKKIYKLDLQTGTKGEFLCKACNKQLGFQKIVAIKNCGHCFCKKCWEEYCPLNSWEEKDPEQKDLTKFGLCFCSKKFLEGDVITMKEGMTSFSNHNKVEAKLYTPSFAI